MMQCKHKAKSILLVYQLLHVGVFISLTYFAGLLKIKVHKSLIHHFDLLGKKMCKTTPELINEKIPKQKY